MQLLWKLPVVMISLGLINVGIWGQGTEFRKPDTHVAAAESVPFSALPRATDALRDDPGPQVHPDGPAPPLTRIFVNNVCSPTSCETIASGQTITANTYTGSDVYVYV